MTSWLQYNPNDTHPNFLYFCYFRCSLEGFKQKYSKQSKQIVADAGYGSEQNYELLQKQGIEAFVKFNYFHKEQKRGLKNDSLGIQNLFYNSEKDFYVWPNGATNAEIRRYHTHQQQWV